jgi:hypothetical protein
MMANGVIRPVADISVDIYAWPLRKHEASGLMWFAGAVGLGLATMSLI